MATITQPLRVEHRALLPRIEALRTAAKRVAASPIDGLTRTVDDAQGFLTPKLIPHAEAEDRALYPVVGRLMGAPHATRTMAHEHAEVIRLTRQLGVLRSQLTSRTLNSVLADELRRALYGLHAILKLHFAKEEEIYLPIFEARLSAPEAEKMFQAMERAAAEAKQRASSGSLIQGGR